ncbi:E2 ubiquitin-conjugating protein mms2 [Coemansia brasiliensis]|uniref:E2 ubiquitin-conjugating protein mms2 n=1 Tax=Coemansia brasiliensis TaxID=2650707 RepID=A0A9W8M160_9FUNG|nr:E2 ubiquitin-conjugating protein mms2 [Coemansia brasiliensis]
MYFVEPRNFVLLRELEQAEKGIGDGRCSYGLKTPDDVMMYRWDGTIFDPHHSSSENGFYALEIYCGDDYPKKPPTVSFTQPLRMPGLRDDMCTVDFSAIDGLKTWKASYGMAHVLKCLYNHIVKHKPRSLR